MKRSLTSGVAGVVIMAVAGCELASQVQARTVAVSTLLATPRIEIAGEAKAGNDGPVIPTFDAGGFTFDAGLGGPIVILPQNLVLVFFGIRPGSDLTAVPVGQSGATITVSQVGGGSWSLVEQAGGTYTLPPDAGFVYTDSATYRFTYELAGVTYLAEVKQVPPAERITRFEAAPGYMLVDAGTSVTFTRPDPLASQARPLGFVTVFPVSSAGAQLQSTYSNVPSTVIDYLAVVASPSKWQSTVVEIPGTAFPEKDRNYIIVLQSAKLGGPTSENLFAGSAILAGTAAVGIVRTAP